MRFLLALVPMLAAACAPAPEPAAAPRTTAAPPPREVAKAAPPVAAQPVSNEYDRCPDREVRLHQAKRTIEAFHAKVKRLSPLEDWVKLHKCEIKDTTGSVLVTRRREAGGVRVIAKQGHVNDLVCDVPEEAFPEGLDADALIELDRINSHSETDPLVAFGESCRDPVLEVTYGDVKKQKKILLLE